MAARQKGKALAKAGAFWYFSPDIAGLQKGLQSTSLREAVKEGAWGDEAILTVNLRDYLGDRQLRLLRPGFPQVLFAPRNDVV